MVSPLVAAGWFTPPESSAFAPCHGWWNCMSQDNRVLLIAVGVIAVVALVAIVVFRPRRRGD